jgi:hypothetical protein
MVPFGATYAEGLSLQYDGWRFAIDSVESNGNQGPIQLGSDGNIPIAGEIVGNVSNDSKLLKPRPHPCVGA